MRKRMEIHALQQAVCKLIVLLDYVFGGKLEGWGRNNCGLKVEVRPVNKPNNAYLDIHPANWPKESFIFARFYGDEEEGWGQLEGQIEAPHIRTPDGAEPFKVSFEIPNFDMPHRASIGVIDKGTSSAAIFRELAAQAGLLSISERSHPADDLNKDQNWREYQRLTSNRIWYSQNVGRLVAIRNGLLLGIYDCEEDYLYTKIIFARGTLWHQSSSKTKYLIFS